MKRISNIVAALVILIGLVWAFQGAGVLGGSFMTGQSQWLYIGIVTALAGLVGLVLVNRRWR